MLLVNVALGERLTRSLLRWSTSSPFGGKMETAFLSQRRGAVNRRCVNAGNYLNNCNIFHQMAVVANPIIKPIPITKLERRGFN
ncbi:MAG: hypothetical protein JWR67_931 [Mucilaginibacter sp.]|nr:hypothetical protein [Mucilaginibacter sp.]